MAGPALTPDTGRDAATLLREAEVRAERTVGTLRMAVSAALALTFLVAVLGTVPEDNAMLERQLLAAGTTLGTYFLFGAATVRLAGRHRVWPWLGWVFAAVDVLFVAVNVHLTARNTGLPTNFGAGFPVVWLAPLVLAFGALRYNPWFQGFQVALLALGLVLMIATGELHDVPQDSTPAALGYFFGVPPNAMRGAMLLLAGVVLVLAAARARGLLRRALEEARRRTNLTRYLPPQIAGRLADLPAAELRAGRRQVVTVLFCDVRGFTARAEGMDPAALSAFVTGFRAAITRAAECTDGVIDKFVGDGAMLVFGVPDPRPDDAARALACAEALPREVAAWDPAVRVGVGMHHGPVFCGAVGDDSRLEYTVLGDTVNVAARLEQLTKSAGFTIVASADALGAAGIRPEAEGWTPLPAEPLRGRNQPVKLFGRAPR
ncbi:adenylate/guanylate cyclase domain-containing protein [Azospirillum sp. RWY-5-1]|uniref:Adenylate/guanylate cyclase domain-containing protein n=1 Tax=Azospirillum oleiclasticum TaxID=2735135 RepID=A0ABX2TDI4_9PROT|nr:adenylate/guanylate cyclase domain-containing protein [Azospirillum oleiclasticum]NYZ14616.1 adenylate/guanylate cyclase domain-containing protein [Azospirillum oleiclasticum]NYZ22397.1 adenylate/guanylate cyclase domain-containing protein [Azospirillum oleiclasticum]